MRIRTIKPELWQSERLAKVSREARLLFVGLFSMADDSGRTRAASRLLASTLFPYDLDACALIEGWMDELAAIGAVRLYEVDGCHYLDIPKWSEHQKIDKPSKSKLPEFVESSRILPEPSRKIALDQGSGIRDQGREGSAASAMAADPYRALAAWVNSHSKDSKRVEENRSAIAGLVATYGLKEVQSAAEVACHAAGEKVWPESLLPVLIARQKGQERQQSTFPDYRNLPQDEFRLPRKVKA